MDVTSLLNANSLAVEQQRKEEKDAENASLRQEVEALRGEVATQEDRIAWLEEQVKKISQGQ